MKSKLLAWITSAILLLPLAATRVLAEVGVIPEGNTSSQMGPGMMSDMMSGGGHWGLSGMVLGPIFMILVLIVLIVAVVYIVRWISSGSGTGVK